MAAARKKRASPRKSTVAKKTAKKRRSVAKRPSSARRAGSARVRSAKKKRPAGGASKKPRGLPNDKAWRELIERAIERADPASGK